MKIRLFKGLENAVNPALAMFGSGMALAMIAVMTATEFSSPPRATGALKIVIIVGVNLGMGLNFWGMRRKRRLPWRERRLRGSTGEAPDRGT